MKIRIFILSAILILGPLSAQAAEYEIDPEHSAVTFKIRHLLGLVNGSFDQFEGRFHYAPDKPETWSVEATIQTESINTKNEQRDNHLKNPDFFDVANFPVMKFKSTKVTDISKDKAKLHGVLSLRGTEKEVVLDLQIFGTDRDPWGSEVAGFSATTMIHRKDFGLLWNQAAESGRMMVGDEVWITIDVEGKTIPPELDEATV